MSKRTLLVILLIWNTLLTAALIWSHTRVGGAKKAVRNLAERIQDGDTLPASIAVERDTAGLRQGRIAYFFMDSISSGYELVEEVKTRVRGEGQRMEGTLRREMEKAQARAQQLAAKDHTYSTQAELEADQLEFQGLQQRIQELQLSSQERLDHMQVEALRQITGDVQELLEEYNTTAGYDFVFSIQDEGQIWVGNKGLDITSDLLKGLNAKHRARKQTPKTGK